MRWNAFAALTALGCLSVIFGQDAAPLSNQNLSDITLTPIPDSMGIISLAMQMEKAAIDHYQSLDSTTPVKEFRPIYRLLARDEQKHYHLLETRKNDLQFDIPAPSDILAESRKLMSGFPIDTLGMEFAEDTAGSLVRVLTDDYELEKKSVSLYENASNKTTSPGGMDIFPFLAREEKRHVRLLEQLIECVTQPEQFLKSNQFNQLENEVDGKE